MRTLLLAGLMVTLMVAPGHAEKVGPPVNPSWHRCKGKHAPDAGPFEKRVALTFDDGPSVTVTPRVLAILRKHKVPATFFMVGHRLRGKKAQALAADIAADPLFSIGNHTFSHPRVPTLEERVAAAEIDRTARAIERASGSTGRFFRFPYSESNCATTSLAHDRGYRVAGWHVDSADWCYAGGKGRCRKRVWRDVPDRLRGDMVGLILERVAASEGGIVLLHDTYPHTAEQLESLIEALSSEGYRFVALDDVGVFPLLNR